MAGKPGKMIPGNQYWRNRHSWIGQVRCPGCDLVYEESVVRGHRIVGDRKGYGALHDMEACERWHRRKEWQQEASEVHREVRRYGPRVDDRLAAREASLEWLRKTNEKLQEATDRKAYWKGADAPWMREWLEAQVKAGTGNESECLCGAKVVWVQDGGRNRCYTRDGLLHFSACPKWVERRHEPK